MPNQPLTPRPGVNTQGTPLLVGEGWIASSLIRFHQGLLQSLGGWSQLASAAFVGICRGLRPFFDLSGNTYVAVGTTQRLQLLNAGTLTDITPIRVSSNLATPMSTTNGSPIVKVTDSVVVAIGDWVNIRTAVYVGGLLIQGLYQVTAVGSGNWSFNAGANATSTVTNGGVLAFYTVTTSSRTVTITLTGYTFTNGQTWIVGGPTTLGGITLSGPYVLTVSGSTTFQSAIAASGNASENENSNNVQIAYLIQTAVEGPTSGTALYGLGSYGVGPYGSGTQVAPFGGYLRQWSLDAWGSDLIANPTDGALYVWIPPIAFENVATIISNAPAQATGSFVTAPTQQIMAYAATNPSTSAQDPLLVRWCDVSDYTDWTASATNQAGSYRLSSGNRIVSGLQGPNTCFFFTDLDLWVANYLGFPLVWGFTKVGKNCGLLCQRGWAMLGGLLVWIGQDSFYEYDGSAVQPIECTVWDFIFDNIDPGFPGATFLGSNAYFNEIFVFFPMSGSGGVCNAYVKWNKKDRVWDYGQAAVLQRSAWTDQSIAGQPIGADYTGMIQQHETGNTANGAAMDCWAQSGWMALNEGTTFISLKKILLDFKIVGTEAMIVTVFLTDFTDPTDQAVPRQYGPYSVNSSTQYLWIMGRGRYVAIKVESNSTGTFWRLGKLHGVQQQDGRR